MSCSVHVAAKLNQKIAKATRAKDISRAVHCVTLTDAAEVHDHAFAAKEHRRRPLVDFELAVIDEATAAKDFALFGNRSILVLVIEFPKSGHHAESHIELAAGPFTDLPCRSENVTKLCPDLNRMLSCGRVQLLHIAILAPGA